MNKEVIIETERLILRQYKLEDADDIVEGLNNINVTKWLQGAPYPYTKEDALNFINKSLDNKLYNFAIVLKSENKVIGGTQLTNIDLHNGTAGGGIWISEKYWGKGYGTEAFCARIKFAFEVLGLRRLENGFFDGNESSWKMQQRFGYKLEGTKRQRYKCLSTGKIVDEHITGLLKEEWIQYENKTNNNK
jgi:RimJ/RimL family protein N-acetyltransferase